MLCILPALLCGCTHNNGDIGPLFGTWRLDAISYDTVSADGSPQHGLDEVGDVFWSFQNHVVKIDRVYPHHITDSRFGTWQRPDDTTLVVNFDNSETDLDFADRYLMLPGIHLPEHGAAMTVKELSSHKMTLVYIDQADGQTVPTAYTYFFTKW